MAENNTPNDPSVFLREMVEAMDRQKRQKIERCIAHLSTYEIPTPSHICRTINSLIGHERQNVLSYHPFWKEQALRQGLASLIHASHQASMDICRHDAALGELARSENFQDGVDLYVSFPSQKDTVAYCALAMGVKSTLKEIQGLRTDICDELGKLVDNLFDEDISQFIRELRNNLLHGRIVIPQWEISYSNEKGRNAGSMVYNIENLLRSGHWNEEAKRYILSSQDEKINLSSVIRDHFKVMNDLYRSVNSMFFKNITLVEKDFHDIEDTHKKQVRTQWARILVEQAAVGKNPYDHLHSFFDPETVREILRLPPHSREQVDFIISLKSAEIDWDDRLRNTMYKIFGVADYTDT